MACITHSRADDNGLKNITIYQGQKEENTHQELF